MSCSWCGDSGKECGCGLGHCAHCGGTGNVATPPFGDGTASKISEESVHYYAKAATDLRCIGTEGMILGVAYGAAKVQLPPEDIHKFIVYWNNCYRDATLGEFIRQIAERAEQLRG